MQEVALDWTPSRFDLKVDRRADGAVLLRPTAELAPYPRRVTDMLELWAAKTPASTFVARRGPDGSWQHVSYAQALNQVRRLAGGLARLGLNAERPLLILSGNGIEHLLLGLAAMYVGVPYCPVSPAYSQASSDLSRLRYVLDLMTPGLVAAFGTGPYARAIQHAVPRETAILTDSLEVAGRQILQYVEFGAEAPDAAESLHRATGPDTKAKFLLTSGSAGQPKAVITTQRMLCSNQIMLREALPFVTGQPPVLVDWLPWNHTFGGSHNVGLVLFNGGSLISTKASRSRSTLPKRSAICARSRRPFTSMYPKGSTCWPRTYIRTQCCATTSTSNFACASLPAPVFRNILGTRWTARRESPGDAAYPYSLGSVPLRPHPR